MSEGEVVKQIFDDTDALIKAVEKYLPYMILEREIKEVAELYKHITK